MGIFYEHSSTTSYTRGIGSQGPRELPGVGFVVKGSNYSLENWKLVDIKQGTDPNDVVTKSQIELLNGARAGYVVNEKAVVYSPSGSIYTQSLHLKDKPDIAGNSDVIRIMTEHQ